MAVISNSGTAMVTLRTTEALLCTGRMNTVPSVGEVINVDKCRYVITEREWQVISKTVKSGYDYIDGNIVVFQCTLWLEEISND